MLFEALGPDLLLNRWRILAQRPCFSNYSENLHVPLWVANIFEKSRISGVCKVRR